jgi:hypothetical protein
MVKAVSEIQHFSTATAILWFLHNQPPGLRERTPPLIFSKKRSFRNPFINSNPVKTTFLGYPTASSLIYQQFKN